MSTTPETGTARNVVLVHGGFVDGSGWRGVYDALRADGHRVSVVQNPTLSLADDVATTRRVLDAQDGPTVLVGHSYGGAVITEAKHPPERLGARLRHRVRARQGRVREHPHRRPAARRPVPPILPPVDGFLFLDREKFAASFAGDLPAADAEFLADSQVPWGVEALAGVITEPAWQSRPSHYLVATDDRMIPPPAQRAMAERAGATVAETAGSHAVYVSKPAEVAAFIAKAASGTTT